MQQKKYIWKLPWWYQCFLSCPATNYVYFRFKKEKKHANVQINCLHVLSLSQSEHVKMLWIKG